MQSRTFLILTLLLIVIAAPVVDATACDDCKHSVPLRDMTQRLVNRADHSTSAQLTSDSGGSDTQNPVTPQDLCPACANIAALSHSTCDALTTITQSNHLLKLLALSDPSYSIIKPPQN